MAQNSGLTYREKKFQFSFFPGISTNGLYSAHYFNKYSFNLTSGISAGNRYFELGLVSNLNIRNSSGIQIAGLANVIGSNAFINLTQFEQKELQEGGLSLDFKGIQFSGILNYVQDEVTGFQFTGGFNVNQGDVLAWQVAGLANVAGGEVAGFQIGGLLNFSGKHVNGVQLSGVMNVAEGELNGLQVGLINSSKRIGGKRSKQRTTNRGFQLGLVNRSIIMDGVQIGLINKGKLARGTQIGLINVFRPGPYQGEGANGKYGTPFGLLNIGFSGNHLRLYTNEVFLTVAEFATGNCFNCSWTQSQMPLSGRFKIRNQNALIFGYNAVDGFNDEIRWGAGYGFAKVHYNKSSMNAFDPNNARVFIGTGVRVIHLNRGERFSKELSLLTKFHGEFGVRFLGVYFFAGLSLNAYVSENELTNRSLEIVNRRSESISYQLWPGYTFGIQL